MNYAITSIVTMGAIYLLQGDIRLGVGALVSAGVLALCRTLAHNLGIHM